MKTINVFYVVVSGLYIATCIILHSIEGVDLVFWYAITTPILLIRLIRALLLISLEKEEQVEEQECEILN
jgi:multisubunit Na+/H+ antiporter MnhG subunit